MEDRDEFGDIEGQLHHQEKFSKSEVVGKKFRYSGGLYRIQKIERRTWRGQPEIWYHIRMIEPPHSVETIPIEVFREHFRCGRAVEIDRTEPLEFEFSNPPNIPLATKIKNRMLGKKDYTCPECGFESNVSEKFTDMGYYGGGQYYCMNCVKEKDNLRKRYEKTKFGEGEISPSKMVGRRFKLEFHFGSEAIFDIEKIENENYLTRNIELNRDGGHSYHDFWKDFEHGGIKWGTE